MKSADPIAPPSPPGPLGLPAGVWALAVFGATLAAYLPALHGSVLWDDAAHITARRLQDWGGLSRIWFRLGTTQQYYPVLHSAFWLEHRLWGDSVLGYHLANVLQHAGAACLFALVLARIRPGPGATGAPVLGDWLAAALFALHPVCVESVAWISEQKNTLSLVFYLLSALAYLRFDRERRPGAYALAFGLFVLALLSKTVTATLPGALLLAIAWRRGRLSWRRDVAPLAPWFIVGACAGLFTAWVEQHLIGARGEAFDLGPVRRCFLAGRIVWFYLGKIAWPTHLSFIYPHWQVRADAPWSLGCAGLAAAFAALIGLRHMSRAPLIAMLFFVGSLFPVLGFFNVYPFLFSYVADHFQYLPCLGIMALGAEGAAAGAGRLLRQLYGRRLAAARWALGGAAAALLVLLFTMTRRQCALYADVGALYSDTLARNPGCWMAHNNLGVFLMETGSLDASIAHLEEAVRLKPDYSEARNNLGNALIKVPGRSAEAVSEFESALRLEPGLTQARANLGLALVNVPGRQAEGIELIEAVLRENPDDAGFANLHASLAQALSAAPGRLPEAIAEFEAALASNPDQQDTRNNLGIALDRAGRPKDALVQFERILAAHPGNPEAQSNLGSVLLQLGRGAEAVEHYREALRLKPDYLDARFDLGRALMGVGDAQEALEQFRQALRLAPESADIRASMGTVLYGQRKFDEAVAAYRAAVGLRPDSAAFRQSLGSALAAAGRIDDAVIELRKAVELAPGDAKAHYNLAVALLRSGRDQEADAEFRASGLARP
jgi:tetratricopeptide (TPR) repeat protein